MTIWICQTCGIEHPDSETAPEATCLICADERQWVPETGQVWTTPAEVAATHSYRISEVEPDLYAIDTEPGIGIGQRTFVVRTEVGAVLWEPSALFTAALVDDVLATIGPVRAVAASHPHLVGAAVSWAETLELPYFVAAADRRWIRRPSSRIELWQDRVDLLQGGDAHGQAGVSLVQVGGHFPGSAVLHWPAGADGTGVLLTGDSIAVKPDRRSVSFMRSYVNDIPLSERLVRQIVRRVDPLRFDRVHGAFGASILTGAEESVRCSADRYVGWLTDAIRDPDDTDL